MTCKSPFYSRDIRPKTIAAPTGDGYELEYSITIDERGHKELAATGKTNAYAMIQSFAEECKIENILQRSILDPSVLNARAAMYDDFTDAPKSLYEAQNMMIEMEKLWNGLSAAERNQYDGELSQFIAAVGSEKWLKTMGMIETPTVTETPEPTTQKGDEK